MLRLSQRALLALCLMLCFSCSSPIIREWEIQENVTQSSRYNSGRLLLCPDTDFSYLELEILRDSSGIRFFINLLFMVAPPLADDTTRTSVEILFDQYDPWTIYPFLLEGGQRLLLSGESADILIKALLEEESFTIQVGRNKINVIPNNFQTTYSQLLAIPIEEDCQTSNF